MPASDRPYMGAIPYTGGCTFRIWAPFAAQVSVAGDFNGWKPETAIPMRKQANGEWAATVQLPAGRHLYKLIVDGKWLPDPENPMQEDDNFGGKNSEVMVGK